MGRGRSCAGSKGPPCPRGGLLQYTAERGATSATRCGPQPRVANQLTISAARIVSPPLSAVDEEVASQRGAGVVVDVLATRRGRDRHEGSGGAVVDVQPHRG